MADPTLSEVLLGRNSAFPSAFSAEGAKQAAMLFPNMATGAYRTLAQFMRDGYDPGTGDERGIQNAANVAGIIAAPSLGLNAVGAVPQGAVGIFGGRLAKTSGEWPVQAALKLGDHPIFTGESHFDALEQAKKSLGDRAVEGLLETAGDGFITNTGRYVTREEAGALADALNKTRYYKGKQGKEGFIAEALDAYDPKTGKQIANPLDVMGAYEGK